MNGAGSAFECWVTLRVAQLGIPCGWRCSGSDAFLRFCIHGMNCNEMDLSQVRQ
ncbi:hypothetical protein IVW58_04925 [Salmonella enterica subsp. enterica serovar Worthington]|nr:hypothetical protein [Salmonella enterica subsp. enterica serovar Worthington]MBP1522718.1 hypothetical protein [Salmonella enterica subsp. enterica serovar Worthington]MBP1524325.1 hypothetical protein [Salmonella enterica subsp. enterica serovar Worthington]